jgi:hypothetical protein
LLVFSAHINRNKQGIQGVAGKTWQGIKWQITSKWWGLSIRMLGTQRYTLDIRLALLTGNYSFCMLIYLRTWDMWWGPMNNHFSLCFYIVRFFKFFKWQIL